MVSEPSFDEIPAIDERGRLKEIDEDFEVREDFIPLQERAPAAEVLLSIGNGFDVCTLWNALVKESFCREACRICPGARRHEEPGSSG